MSAFVCSAKHFQQIADAMYFMATTANSPAHLSTLRYLKKHGTIASSEDIRIRELAETRARLCSRSGVATRSSENIVGSILNFGVNGEVSTFSPELLTAPPTSTYASFVWGNVHADTYQTFLDNLASTIAYRDLRRGVEACKEACDYFSVCGGGAPSNKLGELGTLDATETLCCRLRVQALTRVVLRNLEAEVREATNERNNI